MDAAGAVFPVTIDPLASSNSWTSVSDQNDAYWGYSVAPAGDVNGDGYSDVIVGAPFFDSFSTNEGHAWVYMGSATGLTTNRSPALTPGFFMESAQFGQSVASAGDVNGDGYSDVIVGAPGYDNFDFDIGRAYVFLGSSSGVTNSAAWVKNGNAFSRYGFSVASAGDINGDGYSDVIIGADRFTNGQTSEGRVFVYMGSASGLGASEAWTGEINQDWAAYGHSVSSAGDVNGDGYSDVMIGARYYDNGEGDEGRVYVYFGSASGLVSSGPWTAESNQSNAEFGGSVASAGDVNGDGYSDVIVGAPFYDNGQTDEGRAYLYLGQASGLATSPAWTAEGNQDGAGFGTSVASAGDINGDGYSDTLVGAKDFDNGETDEGRAYLYLGTSSGLSSGAAWTAEGNQASANFGWTVASAGDVNGDGYSDVVVGAPNYDDGQNDEGRAYAYLGSASGLSSSPGVTKESDGNDVQFGTSVASAGDVNGDGYSEVIIGAPRYDNTQTDEGTAIVYNGGAFGPSSFQDWFADGEQNSARLGASVASAGDVNGDGYSDVIVGVPLFDNGQTDEGRAYVYLGSSTGLVFTPAWTVESNQANAQFGSSVASAGDINGDGYTDVIVGAPRFDNGQTDEGRAYVYLGSTTGLATSAAWTTESDQANAFFAASVATAGDVNNDGYSDVIVGAWAYSNGQTNEGLANVYLGSASGLIISPAWTVESNQSGAWFGLSVASAGDVNGDGYSDVVVGAPFFTNGESFEGRAFLYTGSGSGLTTTSAWTAESDQANANYGVSVASAGDVNGDGYSDVLVGANLYDGGQTDEGRAYMYLGSASGLTTSSAWTVESNQTSAQFGNCVASAGDVNGDGYSDVIIGAPLLDNGQTDEGRANIYYGNGEAGRGFRLIPRQRRGDNSAPLDVGGLSNNPAGIRLAAIGRAPYGRAKVKLQWEIKPAGTPFNGTGLGQSASWLDSGTIGVALNELIGGQAPSSRYHWRVRLLYNPATAPAQQASRWVTYDAKSAERTTFRTGVSVPVGLASFTLE